MACAKHSAINIVGGKGTNTICNFKTCIKSNRGKSSANTTNSTQDKRKGANTCQLFSERGNVNTNQWLNENKTKQNTSSNVGENAEQWELIIGGDIN